MMLERKTDDNCMSDTLIIDDSEHDSLSTSIAKRELKVRNIGIIKPSTSTPCSQSSPGDRNNLMHSSKSLLKTPSPQINSDEYLEQSPLDINFNDFMTPLKKTADGERIVQPEESGAHTNLTSNCNQFEGNRLFKQNSIRPVSR